MVDTERWLDGSFPQIQVVRGKEGDPERLVREVSSFLQMGFRQVEWGGEGRMDDLRNLESLPDRSGGGSLG